jgi:hypothetical protein
MQNFPVEIQDFADRFVQMQAKRHLADYDPNERFYKSAVIADIDAARVAIDGFLTMPLRDRRAFAAHVLLRPPRK